MTFRGKDGSTSALCDLTKGSAQADAKDHINRMGVSSSKGQPLTAVVEVGTEDTGSDSYQ